jgi:hypothetical protein
VSGGHLQSLEPPPSGTDTNNRERHHCTTTVRTVTSKSTGADPHYLDVWQTAHEGDATIAEKLVGK